MWSENGRSGNLAPPLPRKSISTLSKQSGSWVDWQLAWSSGGGVLHCPEGPLPYCLGPGGLRLPPTHPREESTGGEAKGDPARETQHQGEGWQRGTRQSWEEPIASL